MPKGLIINDMGTLYRISRRNWRRFCRAMAEEQPFASVCQFGGVRLGWIDHNITDWNAEDYAEELKSGA